MENRLPNFLIVGTGKAGTTALYDYFKQHPDIYMSPVKEPLFFAKDIIEQTDNHYKGRQFSPYRSESDYLSLFGDAKDEKILGECNTENIFSKVAAQEIYRFNPEAKILILLRDPVDYLYSRHSQLLVEPAEDVVDFETALSLESKRMNGLNLPPYYQWPGKFAYSQRVKYYDQVKRYYDIFPKGQIKLIVYEDFRDDNLGVYKDILEFLDVDPAFTPKSKKVNVCKRPRSLKLSFWVTHSCFSKFFLKKCLPRSVYEKIKGVLKDKVLLKEQVRRPMNAELRTALMRKYKPEVRKVSQFVGVDLIEKWGYEDC